MKCSKCNKKNKKIALYCEKCGNKFSEKEIERARKHSIVGVFDFIENIYDICSLSVITDTLVFKILSIIVVFSVGVFITILNGTHFKIQESDNYTIRYNGEKEEYYLVTNSEKVLINLYIPNRVEDITVKEYNGDNLINEATFPKDTEISLDKNNDNYYVLEANYDKKKEDIKLYVFENSDLVGDKSE